MVRKIKFRGQRKDGKTWLHGDLIQIVGLVFIDFKKSDYLVWAGSVGQFTGLRDSNTTKESPDGQEIYEGDILRWTFEDIPIDDHSEENAEYWETGCVKWFGDDGDYPAFDVEPQINTESNGLSHLMAMARTIEIIGNIHDNPELLEVQNGKIRSK